MAVLNQRNNFDPVASVYDRLARLVFGKTLLSARRQFLSAIQTGDHVLIIGGGTGELLPELLNRVGEGGAITFLELSAEMLRQAQDRFDSPPSQIRFVHGDQWQLREGDTYQVLLTNFFLDLFPQQKASRILTHLLQLLSPNGSWLLTDFFVPEQAPFRSMGRGLIQLMYWFFRWQCQLEAKHLPDFDGMVPGGWQLLEERRYWKGLIRARRYRRAQ